MNLIFIILIAINIKKTILVDWENYIYDTELYLSFNQITSIEGVQNLIKLQRDEFDRSNKQKSYSSSQCHTCILVLAFQRLNPHVMASFE